MLQEQTNLVVLEEVVWVGGHVEGGQEAFLEGDPVEDLEVSLEVVLVA